MGWIRSGSAKSSQYSVLYSSRMGQFPTFILIFFFFFGAFNSELYIDNFEVSTNISEWQEYSDTLMPGGKSKAVFVLHHTHNSKTAILFTLLNPQPCGAALAGFKKTIDLDISNYENISLSVRGRGEYRRYEVVLRHGGEKTPDNKSYVHFFEAPSTIETIILPISEFKPYVMGELVKGEEPLDVKHITTLGILANGGIRLPLKQVGVAALEIRWIRVD